MIREKIITVFGGSGFIGRHLVKRLSKSGALIRVAVRDVSSANYLRSMGEVGQIVPVATDIGDKRSVAVAVDGVEEVVNLVGVLWERGSQNFSRIHTTDFDCYRVTLHGLVPDSMDYVVFRSCHASGNL